MIKIAVINQKGTKKFEDVDGLARTFVDGLKLLSKEIEFKLFSDTEEVDFINFVKSADLIVYIWAKRYIDTELVSRIGLFEKTIYLDGSEPGKNARYDKTIPVTINGNMLDKCALYFRREKPYISGIEALPFGIESSYVAGYSSSVKKDIDFVCIFGNEDYPHLRRDATLHLEYFCKKYGFSCFTKKVPRDEYFKVLARSKVGISIGGGGFDTYRFWEILGNNCLLMTEKIDIFEDSKQALPYKRIYEFDNNLKAFHARLEEVATFLKTSYDIGSMDDEYQRILKEHGSVARVRTVLAAAHNKGII